MPYILAILALFYTQVALAGQMRTGDILLQPLDCWSCSLIEQQENSSYSHIGVLIKVDGKDHVAEAYGSVKLVSLKEFLAKTAKGQKVQVKRPYHLKESQQEILKLNLLSYLGQPYDREFLWDNEVNGVEAIYCSELLYKAMALVIKFTDLKPKTMLFDVNPEQWDRYFGGNTPRGKLGISPEDFDLSQDFFFIKYL